MEEAKSTKPVIHQSQLSMLSKCGLLYEFVHVKGVRIPPGIAQVRGTGVHGGAQVNLKNKIATGKLMPVEAVQEAAAQAFKAAWEKEGVRLDEEEVLIGMDKVKGAALDVVTSLAGLHARELAPQLEPVKVEETWRLELKGSPVDLAGTTDVEEKRRVRDLKTSAKSPNADAAETSEQLTVYALAKRTLDGTTGEVEVMLDTLVNNKTPKLVTQKSVRIDDDFREVLERVGRATKVIQSGAFMPADPSNWWCSQRWCGMWSQCPHGARQRKQVAL